ncbi:MAG TPA: glycosyltransferase [Ilumatobacteraceae bacterium]
MISNRVPTRSTPYRLSDVCIVVIAQDAEHSITSVLDRIPSSLAAKAGAVFIADDASADATVEVTRRWIATHPGCNTTVLRQETRRGCNGTQQHCLAWAAEHGHALAVVVHANGQTAPEMMSALLRPLLDGSASAVFGCSAAPSRVTRARRQHGYAGYNLDRLDVRALAAINGNAPLAVAIARHLTIGGHVVADIAIPKVYAFPTPRVTAPRGSWAVAGTSRRVGSWLQAIGHSVVGTRTPAASRRTSTQGIGRLDLSSTSCAPTAPQPQRPRATSTTSGRGRGRSSIS